MSWEELAKFTQKTYGVLVDWEERFFVCPECDEPIYECDWSGDWQMSQGLCPVCEYDIVECEA